MRCSWDLVCSQIRAEALSLACRIALTHITPLRSLQTASDRRCLWRRSVRQSVENRIVHCYERRRQTIIWHGWVVYHRMVKVCMRSDEQILFRNSTIEILQIYLKGKHVCEGVRNVRSNSNSWTSTSNISPFIPLWVLNYGSRRTVSPHS